MSNFDQIGFPVQTEEEFNALCLSYIDKATFEIKSKSGTYVCWQESETFGPELWLQVQDDEIIGMHPFFRGKSDIRAGVETVIDESKITPLDAPMLVWFNPESDESDNMETQCLVDMIRYYAFKKSFPAIEAISIAAFAQDIEVFENEADYIKANPGITENDLNNKDIDFLDMDIFSTLGIGGFIPVGLFHEEDEVPEPIAFFSGKILETKQMVNSMTKKKYQWALVETMGVTIDVVVDHALSNTLFTVGGVLKGAFWMGADFKD